MTIKLASGFKIKVPKNENNKGFPPTGMFNNVPTVMRNGDWQWCSITFMEDNIQIHDVHKVDPVTNQGSDYLPGLFHQEQISNFKKKLLLYAMNDHRVNYKIFNFKKRIHERRRTIWVFTIAVCISLAYHFVNAAFNNEPMKWMNTNVYAHTLMMFLTLAGFIGIFFPFTIQKSLTEKDIQKIASDTYEKKKRDDADYERAKNMSTL